MEPRAREKRIYDPVLGYHYLNNQDLGVISHPLFQRLRRVNQLSAQHLFPSANHKRFEHCLGVMNLGTRAVDHLIQAGAFEQDHLPDSQLAEIRTTARYAFLLHDIGHTPLSHACELFVNREALLTDVTSSPHLVHDVKQQILNPSQFYYEDKKFGTNDLMTCALFLNYILPYLQSGRDQTSPTTSPIPLRYTSRPQVDPNLFCRMVLGLTSAPHLIERILPRLLSDNAHDIDKLDYVYRDSRMTNPDLIAVDVPRLAEGFTVLDRSLVVSAGALGALINLISGRDIMYLWVYNHHTVCYTDELIRRYINHLITVANGDSRALRDRLIIPREYAMRLSHPRHRRRDLVYYYFSKEALCDGVDDGDVWTLLKANRYLDGTTKLLYAQLIDREHLSCVYKTVVGFNAFLEELGGSADTVLRHSKGNGLEPSRLEINIISDNKIEEHDVYVTYRFVKLFEPKQTNQIRVEDPVRHRATPLNTLMGQPSSAPSMFGRVPGEAMVMPFIYYRDDKIDRQTLMGYLKEYRYP